MNRRAPFGLLGMVGLIVLVEVAVARHDADISEPASSSLRLAGRLAVGEAKDCEVLAFGDSLVKHGVLPRAIEAATGRSAYNLSAAATQAPGTYFLLCRALEAGARPRAIIVDFKPNLLGGAPYFKVRPWQEFVNVREWLDLCRTVRKPAFAIQTALGRLLPSYRSRFEVRGAVVAALRGEAPRLREENRMLWRQWDVNRGANYCGKNPHFDGRVGPDQLSIYHAQGWRCHKVNAAYVKRFFALAESRGIPVFWLLPPISPAVQQARDASGADDGHTQFVRSIQARFRNVTVVDARHAGYDHTVFVDPTHLDGDGALAISAELAALLRQPPADRWVGLPVYRPRASAFPIEDVEQSRVVIRNLDGDRRRY